MATAADVLVRVRATGVAQFERDMDRVANKAQQTANKINQAFTGVKFPNVGGVGGGGGGGGGRPGRRPGTQTGTSGGGFGIFQNPLILVPKLMMAMAAYHVASSILTLPRRLADVGMGAIGAAADLESLSNGLRIVMGDAAKATVEFEKLREAAKLPGLGLEEAVRGSIDLQTMGVNAKMARDAMIEISNAVKLAGGGKEEFGRVMLGMTQLIRKGRNAYGQELNLQIGPQMPHMRPILQRTFGTSNSEQLQRMGISGLQIFTALANGMRALPRAVDDTRNAFDNLDDAIKYINAALGKQLAPVFKAFADAVVKFADWAGSSGYFTKVFALFAQTVNKLMGQSAGGNPFLTAVAMLAQALEMLPTTAASALNNAAENWFKVANFMWELKQAFAFVFGNIIAAGRNLIVFIANAFQGLHRVFAQIMEGLARANIAAFGWNMGDRARKMSEADVAYWKEIADYLGRGGATGGRYDYYPWAKVEPSPFKNGAGSPGSMFGKEFNAGVQAKLAGMLGMKSNVEATDPSQWYAEDMAGIAANTGQSAQYLANIDDKMDVLERRVLGGAGIDALAPTAVELGRYRTNGGGINIKVQGGGTMEQLVADIARQVLLQARGAAVI